ncbi:MAG TPA: phosphatase PAP2 family protein [Candidatus Eisenbacteria bacterium]|nr:phosphatase PAP2 family protein [Candidatus Eisenbacteria bacterium]
MAHVAHAQHPGPRQKVNAQAIAPPPARRYRAALFQSYVIVAAVAFVTLAVVAHTVAYFPIDLSITRNIQAYHGVWFARVMFWVSWIGFPPQVQVLVGTIVFSLFVFGLRWEALCLLLASGGVLLGSLVKLIVYRPRPSADLIDVFAQLPSSSFPSGHTLEFTCLGGFLAFLAYSLLKPSTVRVVILSALGALVLLMGLSRIYQGQHWFSDVCGAYLFGSLWLIGTIRVYRWGKTRFFVRQPVAPNPGKQAA